MLDVGGWSFFCNAQSRCMLYVVFVLNLCLVPVSSYHPSPHDVVHLRRPRRFLSMLLFFYHLCAIMVCSGCNYNYIQIQQGGASNNRNKKRFMKSRIRL